MRGTRIVWGGVLVLALGCGGVSDAPERRVVTGTVTLDGVPVEGAAIRFVPQPEGPVAEGKVFNGRYEISNKSGVPLGRHRVEIHGIPILPEDTTGMSLEEMDAATKPAIQIPEKYSKDSKLEETVEAGSAPLTINFELTK